MSVLAWLLMCSAIVYLVTEASLMLPLRPMLASFHPKLMTLLYCRKCVGFWVGAFYGLVGAYPLPLISTVHRWPRIEMAVESGLAFMAAMWILDRWMSPHATFAVEQGMMDGYRTDRGKEAWFHE